LTAVRLVAGPTPQPAQRQPANPPLASENEEIEIDSVDLSSVPPLFHGLMRSAMRDVKSWFTLKGNQTLQLKIGSWGWPSLDKP
jgi:hypothetical protein